MIYCIMIVCARKAKHKIRYDYGRGPAAPAPPHSFQRTNYNNITK